MINIIALFDVLDASVVCRTNLLCQLPSRQCVLIGRLILGGCEWFDMGYTCTYSPSVGGLVMVPLHVWWVVHPVAFLEDTSTVYRIIEETAHDRIVTRR
jgi:hypothetical protein